MSSRLTGLTQTGNWLTRLINPEVTEASLHYSRNTDIVKYFPTRGEFEVFFLVRKMRLIVSSDGRRSVRITFLGPRGQQKVRIYEEVVGDSRWYPSQLETFFDNVSNGSVRHFNTARG